LFYNLESSIPIDADSGYQGLQELHPNCRIPSKASKKHKLTAMEKARNKRLARSILTGIIAEGTC
jgi:hypothetical protein